eukprot:c9643_g1_i1.p1 GENE.c9643_g1_i1~~c9643_g1_i1.p1  ORF type:complete len:1026 (-),score=253.97 c9643_g1_i1:80-2812(-)
MTEQQFLEYAKSVASQNKVLRSHIGMGYYNTVTPNVILRNILESPAWYTPYTPYQAEISQGRLQSLLNFQTGVCELTGMDVANASLLDEATAGAEAMNMCFNLSQKNKKTFLVSNRCHPQTISVVSTRASFIGVDVVVVDNEQMMTHDLTNVCGVMVQYPDTLGAVHSFESIAQRAHENKAMCTVATDLLSLCVLQPPGRWGADIVFGSAQRFGVPMGYGGPNAAFFATKDSHKRTMPGRIIGVSKDSSGRTALRMSLQTREQHIRRERATSNICTAQALLANMAAFYMIFHGPEGLKQIAQQTHGLATLAAEALRQLPSVTIVNDHFFDTIHVRLNAPDAKKVLRLAEENGMNLRLVNDHEITIAFDETSNKQHVQDVVDVFARYAGTTISLPCTGCAVTSSLPSSFIRSDAPLKHEVFSMYTSETDVLRYIYFLQNKDLGLQNAMIPLGSCTMKLNATAEMIPVTWPEFAQLHPFAPPQQAAGYSILFNELSEQLKEITGFDHISLQPNSGAQGEYAGLLAIARYHKKHHDPSKPFRNVCLIPTSAHGTNPASAVMAGMTVEVVQCDEHGNVDVADLKQKALEFKDTLAALMITYPSTHGVFEKTIIEICETIHQCGGLVYMDGANMNAQVGLTRPRDMGADVCHLNLHKTFCIPHGGGGPGMGPIGVRSHLAPFLPAHSVIDVGVPSASTHPSEVTSVSAAPWGSAAILPISWAYISMMGGDGLTHATKMAILNANYMAARLKDHYHILYTGENGHVAHEFILDLRPFKACGVTEVDIAKRLLDYSFHAPTMSWPVHGTIMIEPTESESKAELDRFCDALIAIRKEIAEIEAKNLPQNDNMLKNAPHSLLTITSNEWKHPYSRETAAFPVPSLKVNKFWPTVGRLDDVFGDKNLVCLCPPVSEFARR